jgi:phenylacetate-CoA ligase
MSALLDNLRGWYAASPPAIRESLGKVIAFLPAYLKYGKTMRQTYDNALRAQHDFAFVEAERLKLLRRLIQHAVKAPYYQELFRKTYGGLPEIDSFTFEELERLPLLTKEALRADPEAFLTKPKSEVDTASTSGSSGRPLTFFLDKNRGAKEFAYIASFWSRIGFEYGKSKRAVLRGVAFDNVSEKPWQYDAALKELRLSPFHFTPENMAMFLELMEEHQVEFIHGYPSSIIVFADYIIREKAKVPSSLKGILPVSEATLPHQLDRFAKAFPQCKITKYYGMSEKVVIAGQVGDDSETYEMEPLYGHAELVNEAGEIITQAGETGRVIGTGFISMAMPLLRYDTEDIADFVHAADGDNGYRLRLKHIRGRWGEEYALGKNGELTSMSAINIHSTEYGKVHIFQLYQDEPGKVAVKVVPKPWITAEDLTPFVAEIQSKVGDTIQFTLEVVEDIPFNTSNGKRKFIDQKIDLAPYFER